MPGTDISKLVAIFEGITTKLVASTDPNGLYGAAVQIAMETTDAQACSLYLEQAVMGSAGDVDSFIMMVAGAGFETHRVGKKYKRGQGLTGRIWETSKSVKFDTQAQIEDTKNGWQGLYNQDVAQNVPGWVSYSLIGVPLRVAERTIGVLKVENKRPGMPSYFSDDDRVLLEIIASTIALAIENQRSSEQAYSSILSALRDVSKMLVGPQTITFNTLCDSIVEECIKIFNAEACSLYIEEIGDPAKKEPAHIVMVAGAGYEDTRRGAKYAKGQGLTGSIWQNGVPVKYDSREQVEDPKHGWQGVYNKQVSDKVTGWECCSLIGVPLLIGERTIGVLKVENKKPGKPAHFSHNELRSLEVLASNIALAVEMHRHRELIYERGYQARDFTHSSRTSVQVALSAVHHAMSDLQAPDGYISTEKAIDWLRLSERTLREILELGKRMLSYDPEKHKATLPVNQILRRVIDHCQPVLRSKNIQLSEKLLADDIFTHVDFDEILAAFDNLLGNAIDAVTGRPAPKIWIEATVHPHPEGVDVATILLVDNGPGFTDEQRKEFDYTRRITSTKHGGLGLGMRIAYQSCEDNAVDFKIIDPPSRITDTGAAFQIDLPLSKPRNLRVLIIDDSPDFLELLQKKVSQPSGITVETRTDYDMLQDAINNSAQALSALSSYDLILLDCNFRHKVLNGPELLRRLRERNTDLANRTVLMTSVPEYQTTPGVLDKFADVDAHFPDIVHDLLRRRANQ